MPPATQTILYFGDQTDPWLEGIDQLFRQAKSAPWLQSFLDDLVRVFKETSHGMDSVLQGSLGDYSTLLQLADRYRHAVDEVGLVHAILLHTVRSAMLLQWVKQEPGLVSQMQPKPERLGISGGLTNLCSLAIATDFSTLYDAVLEVARIFFRLCIFTSVRSRAVEDRPGVWGWAILGISPDELSKHLEQSQNSLGIPSISRAKVGVTGDGWSTVIGPPTALEQFVSQCPAVRNVPKHPLNIHALQHTVAVSKADIDYIIGDSSLLETSILPDFRVWGMNDPEATYNNWGDLLRAVVSQVLSLPLDITKVIDQVNKHLGPRQLDVRIIGPSSHTPYIIKAFQGAGSTVNTRTDKSLKQTHLPNLGKIAIVGIAARGPGCDNLDDFWDIIISKQDLCEEIPSDRFEIDEFYCAEHRDTCGTTSRFGCFMNKPGNFDSRFFRISPREALLMDPGHRQFLMSTHEALQMAGYSDGQTKKVDPKRIAAFYGQSNDDWHMVSHYTLGCDAYTLQGAQRAFGAGRAAFHFKWEGPTYSLDSACASSSSAIHLACMSLQTKDVDMAVVGAANIVGYPHSWTSLSKSGVLSDTGNCKTFRDDADGYCRADFVGTVVLKRLEDAEAQNDRILAVVAASGRNHSGNSTSITTSDGVAQASLFGKVMRNAHVSPDDISYIEMHGTGTQIGDPAEMGAVTSVFKHRKGRKPLTVGGVKANIGHSEAAAGMASLVKCVLMFQHDILPPQAGIPHALNPNYPPLDKFNIQILSEPEEFKRVDQKPRRILLNNFDAAGGNACLLLEDYSATGNNGVDPRQSHVVVTSAKTSASFLANKHNLLQWLRANETVPIQDIAYTTTARSQHHNIRFACTASSTKELITQLERDVPDTSLSRPSPVVFVFTGQGSHYANMGSELYATNAVFRDTVDLCGSLCVQHGFTPYLDILTNQDVDISSKDTMQIQLAVLTLEIGLAAFWKSCGVRPAMVIGHSLGEYAALHVSGVLSLADALYLVGHRAKLLLERCETGICAMLAVAASGTAVQEVIDTMNHSSCAIACTNSPKATVVSGSIGDIAELQATLKSPSTILSVPYGFHSFQMDPILNEYVSIASGVTYAPPKIPVASTLIASIIEDKGVFTAQYLGQQTRQVVDFVGALDAIKTALKNPMWLELGPNPVCCSFIRATVAPLQGKVLNSLESKTNPWLSLNQCLSAMFMGGVDIDWMGFHAPFADRLNLLTLPSYAWDLKDFWITYTEVDKTPRLLEAAPALAVAISTCAQHVVTEKLSPNIQVTLRASIADPAFLALINGHRLRSVPVCPGSVFCESGLVAATYALRGRQNAQNTKLAIRNMSLQRPLTKHLVGNEGELLTAVSSDNASSDSFNVSWKVSSMESIHDLGSCTIVTGDTDNHRADISYFAMARMNDLVRDVKVGHGHRLLQEILYALFSNTVEYDPIFKCIKEAFVSSNFEEAAAEVVLHDDPDGTKFTSSPYWGESLVHLAGFLVNSNPKRSTGSDTTFMMDSFDSLDQFRDLKPKRTYFSYVRVSHRDAKTASCDAYVFDSQELVLQCLSLRFHEVSNNVLDRLIGNQVNAPRLPEKVCLAPATQVKELSQAVPARLNAPDTQKQLSISPEAATTEAKQSIVADTRAFDMVLHSISKATGTKVSDLTDQMALADLGVDSIMGIEIATKVQNTVGVDLLPSFMVDYPTIGDLREFFTEIEVVDTRAALPQPSPSESIQVSTDGNSADSVVEDTPKTDGSVTKDDGDVLDILPATAADDNSPAPSTRVTLLQGRPSSGKRTFYLIADGTGSIATYIHLPAFKSNMPIYGIDSPFLRCPSRLTTKIGIPGAAKLIVAVLEKFQPEGPFSIGGFSGGAMLGYEVCRQLAAGGRVVDSLLLLDMCCPRSIGSRDNPLVGWKIYESVAAQGGLWNASNMTQDHLRAVFASVAAYHPPAMTVQERPKRTAIIWAKKGLIDRCSGDSGLLRLLADEDIPTESFPGFMEDPRMGAMAWGLPHKTSKDLGPNGWEKYLGETFCLSVDADHLEMPMPGHVHLLRDAMEQAFTYLSAP